jgi:hypothetical protein
MLTIEDKEILAFLTGYAPPSLRNVKIEKPTAAKVENLYRRMSSQEIRKYGNGKHGATFVRAVNKALGELLSESKNVEK